MRTFMKSIALLVALALVQARADWEYTHWGMTPEQVASASKGAVNEIPPAQRDKGGITESAAKGTYSDGAMKMSVGFLFDTKTEGLICVVYSVLDAAQNEMLEAAMVKRYGPPDHSFDVPRMGKDLTWKNKTDSIELVGGASGSPSQVTHCKAGAQFY